MRGSSVVAWLSVLVLLASPSRGLAQAADFGLGDEPCPGFEQRAQELSATLERSFSSWSLSFELRRTRRGDWVLPYHYEIGVERAVRFSLIR